MKPAHLKPARYLAPLFAALCFTSGYAQDSASASGGNSTAAINLVGDQVIATIHGRTGIANVQGDKVELTNGVVYVNGKSYGAVPKVCEVKYIITKSERKLLVDGKVRNPLP